MLIDLARNDIGRITQTGSVKVTELMVVERYSHVMHIVSNVQGKLEPGKDADFAVWSRSPLDARTVCLQTWIEGKKYFDRTLDPGRTARLEKERADLIAKARQVAKLSGSTGAGEDGSGDSFFRACLEHEFDGQDRHCLDEQ